MHFLGYGLFSMAIATGMTSGFQEQLTFGKTVGSALIAVIYGCLDEYHQSFIEGRTATLSDVLTDSLGAILFLAIASLFLSSRNPGTRS
jgi:VanZ family protein